MTGDVSSKDILQPSEILAANLTCVAKLKTRVNTGKSPDILCLDIDGTIVGDNTTAFESLNSKNVPHVLISGRPDFDAGIDREMADLGVTPADAAIAGAGTLVYWRNNQGGLVLDQEYLSLMKNQQVVHADKEGLAYNPDQLLPLLEQETEVFKPSGVKGVRIDRNQGIGFDTLDIADMSFDQLGKLVTHLRSKFSGIKVEFSEDLTKLDEKSFSGWMQIVPSSGGKDRALRFVLEKIARSIKKPTAHIVGDAAIDIWMLGMGTGVKDAYSAKQYALGNLTLYTRLKLEAMAKALKKQPKAEQRQAHLTILKETSTAGVAKVVDSIEA